MNDSVPGVPRVASAVTPTTAGGLLRQARQAQGLHIAALAAAIKVVPRKLEMLEADQFDQLPDATFTRALANTVCRTLKIDAAPILALLPPLPGHRLEHVATGLKTPFEEGQSGGASREGSVVGGPVLWLAGILIIAAVVVFFAPSSWLQWRPGAHAAVASADPASAAASDAPAAEQSASLAAAAVQSSPAPAATDSTSSADPVMPPGTEVMAPPAESDETDAAASAPARTSTPVAARLLEVTPSDASWVEVIDAKGKTLISRLVQADEHVQLDGAIPLKIKIGNASATQVMFRGQPLDLAPYTRDNMAKLQLK